MERHLTSLGGLIYGFILVQSQNQTEAHQRFHREVLKWVAVGYCAIRQQPN